jgi:hypothetical protein
MVALAKDFSATSFVMSLELLVLECLSLFLALSATGEQARFLDFLCDEVDLVDRLTLIGLGGMFI